MNYSNALIVGFGVTGKALVRFLTHRNIRHTVVDSKPKEKFNQEIINKHEKLLTTFVFGNENFGSITDFDIVLTSPGVPHDNPILIQAKENNIPIKNDVTLFLEEWGALGRKTMGVTGSNGKSTIVTLLHNMILSSGANSILVGNIGQSPLDYLIDLPPAGTIAVMELSSYQLDSFKPEHAVDVAVISNLSSNHLDHYGGSFQKYADAKSNIGTPKKTKLIINSDNFETQKYLGKTLSKYKNNLYAVSLKTDLSEANLPGAYTNEDGDIAISATNKFIFKIGKGLKLIGQHNLYNIAMCLVAFDLLGLRYGDNVERAIREFLGLEHRVEFVKEIRGVKFINDSKSTTPASTAAAIESLAKDKNLILIMGGQDKDMDFNILEPYFRQSVKKAVILPGDSAEKIERLCTNCGVITEGVNDMDAAVKIAYLSSAPDDVILLSPSAASTNMFNNFEHRGQEFKRAVNEFNI